MAASLFESVLLKFEIYGTDLSADRVSPSGEAIVHAT
jgi:hypothetical protein